MRKQGHRNFNFPKITLLAGARFFKVHVSGLGGLGVGETVLISRLRNSNPSSLISPKDNRRNRVANRQFPNSAWAVGMGRSNQMSHGYASGAETGGGGDISALRRRIQNLGQELGP